LLHGQLMESHGISEKNHEKIGMICVSWLPSGKLT
jgi:hypothetical protein